VLQEKKKKRQKQNADKHLMMQPTELSSEEGSINKTNDEKATPYY